MCYNIDSKEREEKKMKDSKIYVVERMVKNGYYLFDETPEHFASRFTLSELLQFEQAFYSFKKNYIFS